MMSFMRESPELEKAGRGDDQAQKAQRPPERIGWAQVSEVGEELTLCVHAIQVGFFAGA